MNAINSIKSLNQQIENCQAVIDEQKENIKNIQGEIAEFVKQNYSLSSLVGSPIIYHRTKWGNIDNENAVLTQKKSEDFAYMDAHTLATGAEFNAAYGTDAFLNDSTYAMYVVYDWESADDPMEAEIWEFLAIELKEGQ